MVHQPSQVTDHKMPGEPQPLNAAHSPTQTHFNYSPNGRPHHSNPTTPAPLPPHHLPYSTGVPPPTSPSAPGLPPLSSALYSRENTGSRYYDPTLDTGDRSAERISTRQYSPPTHSYAVGGQPRAFSPVAAALPNHSPVRQPRLPQAVQTPTSPKLYQPVAQGTPSGQTRQVSQEVACRPVDIEVPSNSGQMHTPARAADPMSLSSIMSGNDADPPSHKRKASKPTSHGYTAKLESAASPVADTPINDTITVLRKSPERVVRNGSAGAASTPLQDISVPNERDVEMALVQIESMELSDVDAPGFEKERVEYFQRGKRRLSEIEQFEAQKRKKRRTIYVQKYHDIFEAHALAGKVRYNAVHEQDAWAEVQRQEIADEKERKKDMQRKRRREKTLQNELQKQTELAEKLQNAADDEERERFLKEAQKADKKIKQTNQLLQGGTPSKDIREVTPHGPNLEGGRIISFQADDSAKEPVKRRGKAGSRLKKTKEQKQLEKEKAAEAQAAIDRGDAPQPIAPKEEARLEALKRSRSQTEEEPAAAPAAVAAPPPTVLTHYSSNVYKELYRQIVRDIAKKDVPKVYRIKDQSLMTKQSNLRKTAQLASKEARRWQIRTNKSMKDVQARAKRSMREMLSFWKRNERDERDQRKLAEKRELENAKKAEAEREANRQKRKLNFLISQTELYSHFIGKKVKTDEVERATDDTAASDQTIRPAAPGAHEIDLPDSVADPSTKVTNFEDLDFDAEDETALRQAAMANAQNAVREAQDRARAFNEQEGKTLDDEGEMNFQNPTSLQNMNIAQPKLLSCQLKEYQLKGLNWLANLYEQGINGILADEMGLGKTVQSISVMAYLAENYNIWGPFLVIAPASTLHNWQQEIAKFVPDFKVLPYWGNAKDRKTLRKFWDRKHLTYRKESQFHVLVTSYQLVVADAQYFQKIKWQYMILDEAQAIKSSQSSRWKSLLGLNCRNRLLLTGTPIQNNMQELWALLHFIMPSLFDSHDEFSDWFSKDIESHAQSNTKLNEDQLRRLHMILKPFMLRRIKKHVQKELGDKIEEDVFCDMTYRQRAYYKSLRNKISFMDLVDKVVGGDEQDNATLMNLVMQFRKVCNHPDLFERAETKSPFQFGYFAETASFMREGQNLNIAYSVRNLIEYKAPRLVCRNGGRLDLAGPDNEKAGWRGKYLNHMMNIWSPDHIMESQRRDDAFSFLRFIDMSPGQASSVARQDIFQRAVELPKRKPWLGRLKVAYEEDGERFEPAHALFNIVERNDRLPLAEIGAEGRMRELLNVSQRAFEASGLNYLEPGAKPAASAPPIELDCSSQGINLEKERYFLNIDMRRALYGINTQTEELILEEKIDPELLPATNLLPAPTNRVSRYTHIEVPSMRRFVTDSGKLATLDRLLRKLKDEGHRVLLYFQMTRMIDLMEEYLTYRNYKYCRLDGSTKLEDRRDTVADFQTRPEIFVFLLSTRAGGLGINLTSADTVIFYDSDWNPTIDSQAMDRAHRLGQTKQVTVYRLITRGTIEERIRKRALQKEEVQRVVISGGAGAHVDFNTRSRENKAKDMAMWLADDDQAAEIEKREAELAAQEANAPPGKKKKASKKRDISLDEMYHEGEGNFADESNKPSGAATPIAEMPAAGKGGAKRRGGGAAGGGGGSKKAKTLKQRLAFADGA